MLGPAPEPAAEDSPINPVSLVSWRPEHEQLVLRAGRSASSHDRRSSGHRVRRGPRHRRRPSQVRVQRPGARRRRRQQSLAARVRPRSGGFVCAAGGGRGRGRRLPRQRRRGRARERHRVGDRARICRFVPTCGTCRSRRPGARWGLSPTRWRSIRWSAARAPARSAGRRRSIRSPAMRRGCSRNGGRREPRTCSCRVAGSAAGLSSRYECSFAAGSTSFSRAVCARRHCVVHFGDRRLRLRQLSGDNPVDQAVVERALRVEVEVGALGVPDDLAERLAGSRTTGSCRSDPASASAARDAARRRSSTASRPTSPARES